MDFEACHLDRIQLQEAIQDVFGADYVVRHVERMHGGAQKVVYRISCSNGFACILYVWDLGMNYFQEDIVNGGLHQASYGSDRFETNNKLLTEHGIRTPALYSLCRDRQLCPYDFALVEYIDGLKAEDYFQSGRASLQDKVFEQLGDMLRTMHGLRRPGYGAADKPEPAPNYCHQLQLDNGKVQLAYAAQHMETIGREQDQLLYKMDELASRIRPRRQFGLIHGELGPDHVLVNGQLEPYLIDIEGAMFFDIEQEHSFLELRFGEFYRYLKRDDLDMDRMTFYRYHHHISLTSGGLKLLHRGFPNRQFAEQLAAYHARCALSFIDRK